MTIGHTHRKEIVKVTIFLLFIFAIIYFTRFTYLKELLTKDFILSYISHTGVWMPLIFILAYIIATCISVPGTIMNGIGGILFGAYYGFAYNWIGAVIGTLICFWISRFLGRDFLARHMSISIRKYDNRHVSKELLMKLIEAARLAPSGNNNQPWKFKIIVSSDESKIGLASTISLRIRVLGILLSSLLTYCLS